MDLLLQASLGFALTGLAFLWARYEVRAIRRDWNEYVQGEMLWYILRSHEPFVWQIIGIFGLGMAGLYFLYRAFAGMSPPW